MRCFVALSVFTLCACAAASPDYRVGGLQGNWQKFTVDGSDVTFKHKDGGTIFANRMCKGVDDVPLDVLTNHLFFDMRIDREISREEITLAGRAALRTHVIAELDGVPVELDLVVLKKDGCTYDMALVADREAFERRQPDFEKFLAGFDELEKAGQG
jgi:hypothetical protein